MAGFEQACLRCGIAHISTGTVPRRVLVWRLPLICRKYGVANLPQTSW